MSGHLGPLAAALVDEQLAGGERERALRHVAQCASCRFEVEQQRAVKARLDELSEPALPGSLFDKLSSMRLPPTEAALPPGPTALPPRPTVLPRPALPLASGRGLGGRPAAAAALPLAGLARPPRSRLRRVLVGATSLVLLGGGAAYAAGGPSGDSGTPVRPAVDVYTVQHGTTSGTVPLNDPAVSAVTVGYGR
jgi:hypothetical protein